MHLQNSLRVCSGIQINFTMHQIWPTLELTHPLSRNRLRLAPWTKILLTYKPPSLISGDDKSNFLSIGIVLKGRSGEVIGQRADGDLIETDTAGKVGGMLDDVLPCEITLPYVDVIVRPFGSVKRGLARPD